MEGVLLIIELILMIIYLKYYLFNDYLINIRKLHKKYKCIYLDKALALSATLAYIILTFILIWV